jgi:hypothetical protein
MITTFWWNVLAAAVGQSVAFIIYQGFVQSWIGIKEIQVVKDFFNTLSKHMRKINGEPNEEKKI